MTETGNTYDPLKRAIDIVGGAATLLVLTVPIQLAAAAGLYATEGGPALFRQERVGRHDRVFTMYKFRTMRPPTDPEEDDADRITALGRVLRSTSIDELPQLWHVLRGQMSLIGPRPLHPRYLPPLFPAPGPAARDPPRDHRIGPGEGPQCGGLGDPIRPGCGLREPPQPPAGPADRPGHPGPAGRSAPQRHRAVPGVPGGERCIMNSLRLGGLLTSIGGTLDAFFPEIVHSWRREGSRSFPPPVRRPTWAARP